MTAIVLVDSDRLASKLTTFLLTDAGYHVVQAFDGSAALATIRRLEPDLVLLEADLPQLSGFDLCEQLRPVFEGAIIFLSSQADLDDRVRGLSVGADDYIAKPFEPSELLARIEAVSRRYQGTVVSTGLQLTRGPITLDAVSQLVFLEDGSSVALTPIETRLLYVLMQHAGQVLYHSDVLALVWGETVLQLGARNLVAVHIYRLRSKVERDVTHPRYILTVDPQGYMFASEPVSVPSGSSPWCSSLAPA